MNTTRAARKDERIGRLGHWQEEDGYWIDLAPGWQNGWDPLCHSIVGRNKREAFTILKDAKPCDCKQCRTTLEVQP